MINPFHCVLKGYPRQKRNSGEHKARTTQCKLFKTAAIKTELRANRLFHWAILELRRHDLDLWGFEVIGQVNTTKHKLIRRPLGCLSATVTSAFPMFQCVWCPVSESKCLLSSEVKCQESLKLKSQHLVLESKAKKPCVTITQAPYQELGWAGNGLEKSSHSSPSHGYHKPAKINTEIKRIPTSVKGWFL